MTTYMYDPCSMVALTTFATYTLFTYSLESHSKGKAIRILDLVTGTSTLFSDDNNNKDIAWLQNEQVLWLRERERGMTELWCGNAVWGEKVGILFSFQKSFCL